MARHDLARHELARHELARHDLARHGLAQLDLAIPVVDKNLWPDLPWSSVAMTSGGRADPILESVRARHGRFGAMDQKAGAKA